MTSFSELTLEAENSKLQCLKKSRRPFISRKKLEGIYLEKSTRLLEDIFFQICIRVGVSQFVECGAHDAYASRKIKSKSPSIHAVAYEANPYVFANYRLMIESDKVLYLNMAISNKVEEVDLIIKSKDTRSWSSEGYLATGVSDEIALEKFRVHATTLDREFECNLKKIPTAMWIDVEGSNQKLIDGGGIYLSSGLVDVIFIESQIDLVWKFELSAPELCDTLLNLGYEAILRDCPGHWGCNILFVRKEIVKNILDLKEEYLLNVRNIELPYLTKFDARTFLSHVKSIFISLIPKRYQTVFHKIFAVLGSKSSQDKLRVSD